MCVGEKIKEGRTGEIGRERWEAISKVVRGKRGGREVEKGMKR